MSRNLPTLRGPFRADQIRSGDPSRPADLKAHLQAFLGRRNPELLKLGIRPVERRKVGPSKKAIAKAAAEAMAQQEAPGGEGQSVNAEA